jgi:PAS domain S-box-containing protein
MNSIPPALRLLVLAPAGSSLAIVQSALRTLPYASELQGVASTPGLRNALQESRWDVVLHLAETSFTASTALRILAELAPDTPLIALVGEAETAAVLSLIRAGARDVIEVSRLAALVPAIERELGETRFRAEHRAALEMLRDSESRFRGLVTHLPGMLFQLRRDANGDFRFLYVSEGCQKLFGRKQHELRAAPHLFFEAFDSAQRHALQEALAQSASTLSLLNWEGRTTARSRSKWLNLRCSPQALDGGATEWHGIATNISESKEIEGALRDSRHQLAELSSHLEIVKEEERERIARDIHDELGSILVRVKIEAALLANKLPADARALREKAASIDELLNQAMGTASRVARELRPGILKEFGLPAALECQAEDFAQRSNIPCRIQCDDESIAPDAETSLALFRIAQEALTNIAKHAHASLVAMRLWREDGKIHFEIRDNGRGIVQDDMNKAKSFGLRGIRERILSLRGEFSIGPGEQGGTCIRISVPEHAEAAAPPPEPPQRSLF